MSNRERAWEQSRAARDGTPAPCDSARARPRWHTGVNVMVDRDVFSTSTKSMSIYG